MLNLSFFNIITGYMTYVPYPDMSDDDAYDKLIRKKEFIKTRYGPEFPYSRTEDICKTGEFTLQYHQEFVRNLISPETPYNSLILLHGTGVGKTCAAIGITEGLRDYVHKNNKKIYILSSENVRPNFYNELYSEKRAEIERKLGSPPGSYQCSGNRYYLETENQRKALIAQYYEFYGFGQFANYVDVHLKASGKSVADVFSNSIIIIDEAHGISVQEHVEEKPGDTYVQLFTKIRDLISEDYSLEPEDTIESLFPEMSSAIKSGGRLSRSAVVASLQDVIEPDDKLVDKIMDLVGGTKKRSKTPAKATATDEDIIDDTDVIREEKKARNVSDRTLFEVLTKTIIPETQKANGNGLKIIMLTATPMKDNITEIADLLEVAVRNDGVSLEKNWRKKLFPTDDSFDKRFLKRQAKGYISYVRGNNPISFPETLMPPPEQVYEPAPIYTYNDPKQEITNEFNIRLAPGVKYTFGLFNCPMDLYQFKCYVSLRRSTGIIDQSDARARMISNIAFPLKKGVKGFKEFTLGGQLLTDEQLNLVYGNSGFKTCFKATMAPETKWKIYSYQPDIFKAYGAFLNIDNPKFPLAHFSRKLDHLCRTINESPGIAYVYSEFINSGALITAMVLENNGWLHYTPGIGNHLLPNGVPRADIEEVLPTSRLFRGYKGEYRCARCGKLSSECKNHEFKIATYVLVTGEQGGAANIAYANMPENKYGDVVKAVIGTKVTGQGVDFKWLRQVHILDPWHNNTRIYQAIGRGARHCSHADLKPEERNVTVYKYSSSALPMESSAAAIKPDEAVELGGESIGITYRDLRTETIDEHMYARIMRKDILVKQIERALKEMAVDCELNTNRNMFANDKDYSRDCDYMKCNYSCDGFSKPVEWIKVHISRTADGRKYDADDKVILGYANLPEIKRLKLGIRSGDDEAIWQALRRMGGKVVTTADGHERMMLDMPDFRIDASTYDAYFIQPQVDKTVKHIMRLYHDKLVMTVETILTAVKRIDPASEDQFVYLALDQLIGNPPTIKPKLFTDQYGRMGYLIYRGRF
jgi:hypothetical protein